MNLPKLLAGRAVLCFCFVISTAMVLAQDDSLATKQLRKQSEQFEKQIIQIADNVYTSVGQSVSNSSIIIGDEGLVVIDTGMTIDAAQKIVAEFRNITDKPVKAIIFTHSHGDHTGGAAAFFGKERPQIWAHVNFGGEAKPLLAAGLSYQRVRGARQAGFKLPADQRINNGVAPVRYPKRGGSAFEAGGDSTPTHFLKGERQKIKIAGIDLELVSAPGETNDQLYVWYPKQGVLFAGDNFYRSFPNLYAIRGTPQRSVRLPNHLANKDYLQPFYGHPEWGVRSVFSGYLGWFDGNPTNLFRLPPKAEAERMAKLAGGNAKLLAAAKTALTSDDNQWAAQLVDHLLALDPHDEQAREIKAEALTKLARKMVNATARSYYLTVARELRESPK
ncbi:MAG: alkyl/aryl-sulfatase [Planctomycetes bacterium]|nr:alkyl/aryl-sulfatase [Planctomycetota bacterium]MCH9723773.1 alkyl/aryl-sulfatase [Planctomycetota bacterium]MCH9776085.1 alkyl/aryl-sulfatase [Planctomycetota bacterium]MCH9789826.1 alkyl/aryl-sulfatase [Planctomycetota bacterium]